MHAKQVKHEWTPSKDIHLLTDWLTDWLTYLMERLYMQKIKANAKNQCCDIEISLFQHMPGHAHPKYDN